MNTIKPTNDWRESTRCADGYCVQVRPAWRKSTRSSDPDFAQCVEVAAVDPGVSWIR